MKIDPFVLAVAPTAETPDAPEIGETLRGNFVSFLRAGGSFSWADWCAMSEETCKLAEEAGLEVEAEKLHALASLLTGAPATPDAPAEDPTDALIRARVAAAAAEAVEKAELPE